jgi:uncharacterized DUF497 family protein
MDGKCIYNIIIGDVRFVWDPNKDYLNRRKHRISFIEAVSL